MSRKKSDREKWLEGYPGKQRKAPAKPAEVPVPPPSGFVLRLPEGLDDEDSTQWLENEKWLSATRPMEPSDIPLLEMLLDEQRDERQIKALMKSVEEQGGPVSRYLAKYKGGLRQNPLQKSLKQSQRAQREIRKQLLAKKVTTPVATPQPAAPQGPWDPKSKFYGLICATPEQIAARDEGRMPSMQDIEKKANIREKNT